MTRRHILGDSVDLDCGKYFGSYVAYLVHYSSFFVLNFTSVEFLSRERMELGKDGHHLVMIVIRDMRTNVYILKITAKGNFQERTLTLFPSLQVNA